MASLGFRQPQFSEELAWLPPWLQHPRSETFSDHIKEPQASLEHGDCGFLRGKIAKGEDRNSLLGEEGGYSSCHLFLSGEDNSLITCTPVSTNVLHFCLHLSADGNSQSIPSPSIDTSQAVRFGSNNVTLMRQAETLVGPGEKVCPSKLKYPAGVVKLLPLTSSPTTLKNVSPQSVTSNKVNKTMYEEKSSTRCLKVADADDAVELSISASEALVIHELLNSESPSEAFPAEAVLEVALRVKQARLESLEDPFHYPTEEIDFLSDLPESNMADAFEDVGLSVVGSDNQWSGGSLMSRVEDTPISESRCGFDDKYKHVMLGAQYVGIDNISAQQQSEGILDIDVGLKKNLPFESLSCEGQDKLSDDLALGLNTTCVGSSIEPILHRSAQENSDVKAFDQIERELGFSMVGITSFQPQENVDFPPVNYEGESQKSSLVAERFRSRWFGGWTGKEVDASVQVKQPNSRSIPKLFVGETSFLSESADVAQDENSFVQNNETVSKLASQTSIPFEGLCNKAYKEVLSQDVVKSSSLSFIDPLCSVVPCSISLENDGSGINQNQNDREVDAENCLCSTSEVGEGNMVWGASDPNVELSHAEGQDALIIDGKGSGVRRQFTSLKSYSMLLSSYDTFSKRGKEYCNHSLPVNTNWGSFSSKPKLDQFRSSGKNDSTESLPFISTSKYPIDRDDENNHETSVIKDPVGLLTNEKRICNEPMKDGHLVQVHMSKQRNSPLILNQRMRRLQASEHFANNLKEGKNPEGTSIPDKTVEAQQSKSLKMQKPECQNANDTQVQIRKRVHFADTEVQHPPNKNLQIKQTAQKTCSISRAFKRLKSYNPWLDSRTQKLKWCLTSCCIKQKLIFQGIEFLLTGFSSCKETEIEGLIRKYGGFVIPDIPSPSTSRRKRSSNSNQKQLPIVLCLKKLQTTKFLYGCAVNALMLKVDWLTNSIAAGSLLPPGRYMILSNQADGKYNRIRKPIHRENHKYIFERVGIMLRGKHSFCTRFAKICKHGGGQVFKTLQWLVQSLDAEKVSVGAIVAEDESRALRHLRLCASERKIPMVPATWIINSLHLGKLLPLTEEKHSSPVNKVKLWDVPSAMELSEEI